MAAMSPVPSFNPDEVQLLITAVQRTLEHLRDANERVGGQDPELIATGQQFAKLMQKLQAVAQQ